MFPMTVKPRSGPDVILTSGLRIYHSIHYNYMSVSTRRFSKKIVGTSNSSHRLSFENVWQSRRSIWKSTILLHQGLLKRNNKKKTIFFNRFSGTFIEHQQYSISIVIIMFSEKIIIKSSSLLSQKMTQV